MANTFSAEIIGAVVILLLVFSPLLVSWFATRDSGDAAGFKRDLDDRDDHVVPLRSYTAAPARGPRPAPAAPIGELRGRAHSIDGDTIIIKGTKIRLAGVDAPELDQPFGQKAKWALVEVCKGQVITAKLNGETSHDRLVGTCYLPDGRDIGAELIAQGLALDWAHFSGGKYRHLEPRGVRQKLRNRRTWR